VKILVTGGAGFVGSSLIKELVKDKKNHVLSLDNYFTGKKSNHVTGATYLNGSTEDISNAISVVPDIIYHFGEYSRVSTSFSDIDNVWDSNVSGTKEIIKFCSKNNVKLIYSASSTKFGDHGQNMNASPYAFYKSVNTDLIKNYATWFGLEYAICYFYNVYGKGQISNGDYATVIGIFEDLYRKNKPLTIVPPGTQKRDFTHISDIVNGLALLMNEKVTGDNYCFGTGDSYSILDIASMFGASTTMIGPRRGERTETSIDLQESKKIGWSAKVNIREYVEKIKSGKI
jgi:UDP-glucose 4-epimerase